MEYFKVKKFQISPYLAAISASLAILVGVGILDRSEQQRFLQYNRATTLDRLSTVRSKLESSLNSRLFLIRGLVAYVSNNPNITEAEFAATARILMAQQTGIRAITLVKGTRIAYIYPREGNEGVLGLDLTALPEHRQIVKDVITTRKSLLAGPVKLLEGDMTFISRSPIFLTPSGGSETAVYWGLTGLIVDKNTLFEEAGLNDSSAKLQYSLRGKDGSGASGAVFFGDGSIFQNNPVLLEVTLPNGSWQLAAIPAGGWRANSPFRGWLLFGGGLLAVFTGVAVFTWVYGPVKLRASEAKYRQLVENANSMIVQLDSEGKITFFNECAETFFGYSEAEIIGKSAIGTIIPKTELFESDLATKIRDCLAQQQKYFQNENENIRSNGERVWIAWTNKPLLDAKGNLAGLLCIGTDISDRKQAEIALQASEAELRALFAAMNDIIFEIDIEGRFLKVAPTNPQLLYKPTAEFAGKKISDLFEPQMAEFFLEQIRTALATNQTCTFEYNLEIASLQKWFAATISPMKENTVLWVARDITERKQAESWLTGQKQILEMIAKGAPLGDTLNTLVEIMEQQSRDVIGSILLLAPDGKHLLHGAAPSLPDSYNAAIHGRAIGPDAGSCGTAAFTGQQVIVTDIASDPLWENYRDLALSFGLRACLSTPIFSSQGQVVGTFAMYYSQPRPPQKLDLQLIEAAMHLAGIAIERNQAEESLKQLNQELENRVKDRTAQLMQTEERWQLALKGNNDGIWDWNLQTGELFLSDRFKEITGYDEHSPIVDYFDELNKGTHPDDLALVMQALQDHLNKKTPHYIIEYRCWCYNSAYKWILSRGQALWDASGKAVRMVGSITDITEPKQAEEALRESEARYQKLSANLPGIIYQFLLRADGYFSFPYISPACRELLELEPEAVLQDGTLVRNLIHPDDLQNHDESVAISAQTLQPWQWEGRFVLPSGKIRWFQIVSRPEAKENGAFLWDGIAVDVTDRKQAELALQESQQFIKKVADATPGILYLYDLEEKRNIYTNISMFALLGYTSEEITAMDSSMMPQLIHPEDFPKIVKHHASFAGIEDGETREIEYRVRAADGQIVWLQSRDTIFSRNADGQAKVIIGVSQDITTRKQAEEALRQSEEREREKARDLESALLELRSTQAQLIQTEKMSSLGQLVAGIAHEINNPVNFIHANIDYLNQYTKQLLDLVSLYEQEYPEPNSKIVDRIQDIDLDFMAEDLRKVVASMQVGTERIRQIVLSLRNFSRLDESAMKPVDIHAGIESTLLILQHRLKSHDSHPEIEIIKEFGKLPLVECYASQLNQVFMNIIANGIDAIEERYQKLSVSRSQTPSGRIAICTRVTAQNTVMVEISDNGTGMPQEIVDRIFNPFFTTKAVGKGTGLGMSIAHSIVVEKHNGKIKCISSIGCGTTFQIEIPIDKVYK
jgi:PAS domain S-box-containing protein